MSQKRPTVALCVTITLGFLLTLKFASASDRADLQFKRALLFFRGGRFDQSARVLESLVASRPNQALYWFNLGNTYLAQGRSERSIEAYLKVILLRSKLEPVAAFYIAVAKRKLGLDMAAMPILLNLSKRKLPRNLAEQVQAELNEIQGIRQHEELQLAIQRYRDRDYDRALMEADSANAIRPSGDAEILRGMSLLRLKRIYEARDAFTRVLSLPDTSPSVQEDARLFLRQIKEGLWNLSTYANAYAEVSAGINTNVYGAGDSGQSSLKAISEFAGGVSYFTSLDLAGTNSMRFDYLPSWEETLGVPEDRLISQQIRAQFSRDMRSWLFQAMPSLQHQFLGFHPYLLRPGLFLRGEVKLSSREQVGAVYEVQRILPRDSEVSYIGGVNHFVRGYWATSTRDTEFTLALLYSRESIGDLRTSGGVLPLANWGVGYAASARWHLSSRWEMSAATSLIYKTYDHASEPGPINRRDLVSQIVFRMDYRFRPNLRLFATPAWVLNRSTLGEEAVVDKNFKQLILSLGLSWEWP